MTRGAGADDDAALLMPRIESRILVVRGQRVLIDADLAALYGVPTKALNQAVKRNGERFPSDFMFQLSAGEKVEVVTACDHLRNLKFSKSLPYAFTEHGAIQAANVLNAPRAVEMGIYVVRAFVRLKELSASHADMTRRLGELEGFSRSARAQFQQIFDALRALTQPPPATPKRPIGFVPLVERASGKPKARRP
jgi:ORF6N domain